MAKLDRYREVNAKLSDPRGLTEAQAHALADEGKAIVVQVDEHARHWRSAARRWRRTGVRSAGPQG